MIGLNTVEGAADVFGDGSRDFEIEDVAFESGGEIEALKYPGWRGREFGLLAGF